MTDCAEVTARVTAASITTALGTVRDPELDESIVELGFVAGVEVDGDEVRVGLRLPTYFCAPNFAYLMVADAQEAILAVPGVARARVGLEDHFTSDEINDGVARAQEFDQAFTGLADGDLDELRQTFRRKAFIARQDRLARGLLAEGRTPEGLARLTLRDLPDSDDAAVYRSRRAELGYAVDGDAPLLLDAWGAPVAPEAAVGLLRIGRTTRVSIEGNGGLCRGLLATRYATPETSEKVNA